MAWKNNKLLKVTLAVIMLALGAVFLGLVPISLSFVKEPIERIARQDWDVDLEIGGPLRLRLGPGLRVEAADIVVRKLGSVGNPLARVEELSVNPRLLDLLRGDLHLQRIQITGANFDYCASLPDVEKKEPHARPVPSIAIEKVQATNVKVGCGNGENESSFSIEVAELTGSVPVDESMSATARGRVMNLPVELTALGGSLNELLAGPATFPFRLAITAEAAEMRLTGNISEPLNQIGLTADIELKAQHPDRLFADLGMEISGLPSFEARARGRWALDEVGLDDFVGKMGKSKFDGRGLARLSSERRYFEIEAHLSQLDFDLLRSVSIDTIEHGNLEPTGFRSVFDVLSGFDGKAHVTVDQLVNIPVQAKDLELNVTLSDGQLMLQRLHMLVEGSLVEAEARLELQGDCPDLQASGQVTGVDLKKLVELLDNRLAIDGHIDRIKVHTKSCGDSLVKHRNSAQADIHITNAAVKHENYGTPLLLDTLEAAIGWSRPSRATFRGRLLEEDLTMDVHGGAIRELLAGVPWPIGLEVDGAGAGIILAGNAAISGDSTFLDAHLDINAPRFGALHRWIEVDPENELPLSASTAIQWSNEGIVMDGLSVSLGRSEISGRLESIREDTQPVLVTRLRSGLLDLDELRRAFPRKQETDQSSTQLETEGRGLDRPLFPKGFTLPSIDMDLRIDELDGLDFVVTDIEFKSRFRNQLIDNARLNMKIEDTPLEGLFHLDLRTLPGSIVYEVGATNVDIGRVLDDLDIAQNTRARAGRVAAAYSSHGTTVREFSVNGQLQADIQEIEWIAEDQEQELKLDLQLARLLINSAPDKPTTWETTGQVNGAPVKAWMQTPALGEVFRTESRLPLTVVASFGSDVAMLSGDIDWTGAKGFSGHLVLSGERMDSEAVDFSALKSPLDAFEIHTELRISEQTIALSDLSVRIGSSQAFGDARLSASQDIKKYEIRLQAPHVQTDDFVELIDAWRKYRGKKASTEQVKPATEKGRIWRDVVREYIVALTEKNHFDISIDIGELYAGDQNLGSAQLGIFADENNFRLHPADVALPGGDIEAEYFVTRGPDGIDAVLDIYIERLDYSDLLRLLKPDAREEAGGYLYLNTSLTSRAPTVDQLSTAVQGDLELMIIPKNVRAGVLNLWAANLVMALLPTSKETGKQKDLNCAVASFSVDSGVMKSKDILLDTTDVIVRGKGTIDNGKRTLNLIVAPQAKREKFFSMSTPVTVAGSWDDYRIGVEPIGIVGTAFRLYYGLLYVPYKWLTGERFPPDGLATCFNATNWEMETEDEDTEIIEP